MRRLVAITALVPLLVACGSSAKPAVPSPTPTPVAVTTAQSTSSSSSFTPESAPPPSIDPQDFCATLKSEDLLKSVEGFVIVASVVKPGDVTETVAELEEALVEAPLSLAGQMNDMVSVLNEIDAGATAGDGRTVDTSSIQPDVTAIAGYCSAHHYPVPATV